MAFCKFPHQLTSAWLQPMGGPGTGLDNKRKEKARVFFLSLSVSGGISCVVLASARGCFPLVSLDLGSGNSLLSSYVP